MDFLPPASFSCARLTRPIATEHLNHIKVQFEVKFLFPSTHLSLVVAGDAPHVVVHCGKDRNGVAGHVHSSKHLGRLRDAGQLREQLLWGQVRQLQVDVILQLSTAPVGRQ